MNLNLDRLEFLAAWEFLKPVIPNGEESGKNCLFIRVDEGKVILTAGGEHASKKIVLVHHTDIGDQKNKKPVPKTFMIPKSSLLGFEVLLKEDKKICKKLSKGDPSHLFISITGDKLKSHVNVLEYEQPAYQFKDIEIFFTGNRSPAANDDFFLPPVDVSNIMAGFKKSKQVKALFVKDAEVIHFIQPSTGYEAVLTLPPEENEDPPMTGDDEK